jgi:hypothetical protein
MSADSRSALCMIKTLCLMGLIMEKEGERREI